MHTSEMLNAWQESQALKDVIAAPEMSPKPLCGKMNVREFAIHELNPLQDARWQGFLERNACSSVFHTVAWLEALCRTYGYEPTVITTSPTLAPLQNALVFCRVNSWLTGRRLVSLPFSDHCEPLVHDVSERLALFSALEQRLRCENLRYIEVRPIRPIEDVMLLSKSNLNYYLHELDLKPDLETLHRNFHKSSAQRTIRRAERERLSYEDGRSPALLDAFYRLLLLTRRRHRAPPQPRVWFENLIECFGNDLKIRVASKDSRPVAAILTLRHKKTVTYKYGCSDTRFRSAGGTHLLFWKTIQEAKDEGLRVFDLGRSDCTNEGLVTFKQRWGSVRSTLNYWRLVALPHSREHLSETSWKEQIARRAVAGLPDQMFAMVGNLLYKHVG